MKILHFIYRFVVLPIFFIVLHLSAILHKKIRQSIVGRKKLFENLDEVMKQSHGGGPRFWIHNSSMGEFEQAKPIIAELKRRFPQSSVIVSFLSPSGFDHVKTGDGVDIICYIPFDTTKKARRFLNLVRPDVAIVIRHDIWPNHLAECNKRKIPTILVNSTINPTVWDRIPPGLWVHRYLQRYFDLILTVSQASKAYLLQHRISMGYVSVVGDTRYDRVVHRAREAEDVVSSLRKLKSGRTCIVAGSTWPTDEEALLNGLSRLYDANIPLWTVFVPHEPSIDHTEMLDSRCQRLGLSTQRLSHIEKQRNPEQTDVLIVDRIGILASLYVLGDVTYVGGGFGFGIHNVLEPAAFGRVVLFGPRCRKSYEAGLLQARGVGIVVNSGEDVYREFHSLFEQPEHLTELGKQAEILVQENVGATGRIVNHIENILSVS